MEAGRIAAGRTVVDAAEGPTIELGRVSREVVLDCTAATVEAGVDRLRVLIAGRVEGGFMTVDVIFVPGAAESRECCGFVSSLLGNNELFVGSRLSLLTAGAASVAKARDLDARFVPAAPGKRDVVVDTGTAGRVAGLGSADARGAEVDGRAGGGMLVLVETALPTAVEVAVFTDL